MLVSSGVQETSSSRQSSGGSLLPEVAAKNSVHLEDITLHLRV